MTVQLMQMSDPHFGAERAPVCAALRELAQAQRPQLLLLSGDITQRARRTQFDAARRFVDSLDIPLRMTLPGNHDIPLFNLAARLVAPHAAYRRAFGRAHDAVIDIDGIRLIGLDSTRRWRHVNGELSPAQIANTARCIREAAAGAVRIVALHHPLAVGRSSERHNRVQGHEAALAAWLEAGVDLVLGGHIHLPSVRRLEHGGRMAWSALAGTAVSRRTRRDAGNSVNLLRTGTRNGQRTCTIERWDYRGEADRFELAALSALPLGH